MFEPLPPTQTTPTNSQTGKPPTSPTLRPPSSTSSSATADPKNPSSGVNNSSSSSKSAIAIGASLGAFAFLVVLLGTAYYLRRRQHGQGDVRFIALGGDERGNGADSPHFDGEIPAVSTHGDPVGTVHGGNRGFLNSLGLAGAISAATKMRNEGSTYQRRDMLADEDTRSFGEWYSSRGRDGTGGSSWSLRNILGGGTRLASREASTTSRGTNTGGRNTPRREKLDSFSDGTSLLRDEDTGIMEVVATSGPTRSRANGHRLMSQASSKSGLSYKDPFSDPVQEERRQRSDASDPLLGEEKIEDPLRFSVRHVPVLPSIMTTLPLSQGGHALSPLSEHTHASHHSIPESSTATSSHAHSSENGITHFGGGSSSFGTSRTSVDPFPPSSSIIGTVYNDMRRTDSWWTRFARTTLLDRRLSDTPRKSVTGGRLEIRDPKPPPRLDAIAENIRLGSSSQTSHEEPSLQQRQCSTLGRAVPMVYETGHGMSMSSLRTADSEAIERMAGTMDVFQRINTSSSNRTTGSINSTGGISTDTLGSSVDAGHDNYVSGNETSQGILLDDLPTFSTQAPGGYDALEYSSSRLSSPTLLSAPLSPPPLLLKSNPMSPSSPSVADRIHAFEKRLSLEQTSSPPATNTKCREERIKKRVTVDYGLVPRASLFVANPDSHYFPTSGDS